jgi:hypothetical protein
MTLPIRWKQRGLSINEAFTISFFDEASRVSFDDLVSNPVDHFA